MADSRQMRTLSILIGVASLKAGSDE